LTRWLVALVVALLAILAGYFAFLNPDPVVVHLSPERTMTWPLAAVLLASFAAGGLLVGLMASARAARRAWGRWRAVQRNRRAARQAAATARAQELVWAGEYRQARTELLRGGTNEPTDANRLALLAETHLHEGDPGAARTLIEEALPRVGNDPRLLDLLAEAAERSGDLQGAADALERARAGQPESPRLARRLRDVYRAAGRWSEALALEGEILLHVHDRAALAGEEEVLRGLRYQAALAEPDPRRASRVLLGLAREAPTFVPAWVSAGDLLAGAGRRLAARRAWERGVRRRPAVVLLERLERLNADAGRPERTTRLYRRLMRRHAQTPAIPLLLARHLIGQGALDQAADVLSGLAPPLAADPLVHALWGEVHRGRGNHSLAADSYRRAVGAEPGLASAFRCAVCRHAAERWVGYCGECGRWGTFEARADLPLTASSARH
jgi:tetratricopeptide (TPR) repeat protein